MRRQKSATLFRRAEAIIPGGVNSPVRAFKAVGGEPLFILRGHGSRIWDVDGNEFIDYVGSWGPLILGHAYPIVLRAIRDALSNGITFGAPTEKEIELAELISAAIPSMEMIRLVNSGTEATMSALRLARAYTKREKVVKFAGCYHGHADSLLVKAGSGLATLGTPDSPGVSAATAANTISVEYNDLSAVREAFSRYGAEIAAVIVEPIAANMGVVLPRPGFLKGLREITNEYGSLLIFDEVITGFRVGYGGAQGLYKVRPDLTCLGKIIGGGLPVGAYGGQEKVMSLVAPAGPVYQAGTLSGNPVAVAAGLATLRTLARLHPYADLTEKASYILEGIREAADEAKVLIQTAQAGSIFAIFFTDQEVTNYDSVQKANRKAFTSFFQGMLDRGIYLAPSPFESNFVSVAHTQTDLGNTLKAAKAVLRNFKSSDFSAISQASP